MIISRKIILTIVVLAISGTQAWARQPLYIAKLALPHTSYTIEVPIFSPFLDNEAPITIEAAKHLLKWGMRDTLISTSPLRYHQLGRQIAQVKHTLQGHVSVFDAELLAKEMNEMNYAPKTNLNYQQLANVHADIIHSLQTNKQFQQAFNLTANDIATREDSNEDLITNYQAQLDAEPASDSIALASRLVEARMNAIGRPYFPEQVRTTLQQRFVLLDIAQQNAELGTYLALRFALLHHLYQQRLALRLPPPTSSLTTPKNMRSPHRFHQVREEFNRTIYLLLQQDKS